MTKGTNVEMKMEAMNFSRFSKVKESLKDRLMARFDDRSMNTGISSIITELSDDDLDMVAAAGAGNDTIKINDGMLQDFHSFKKR